MKVKAPNGEIIQVQVGETPEQAAQRWLQAKYKEHGYDPDYKMDVNVDVTGDMDTSDRFLAGAGAGMTDITRNVANLALPDKLTPEWASDEAIKKQRKLDKALTDTTAGAVGKFAGETAALLPVGAIGKGAQVGAQMLPRAAQALRVAAPMAEGVVAGAIAGGPENRVGGATAGAVGGAVGHGIGRALGRVTTRGMVKKNEAAQKLAEEIGKETGEKAPFIPVTTGSAEKGGLSTMGKFIYEEFLPFLPLSRRALQGQVEDFAQAGRKYVLKKALPHRKAYEAALKSGEGRLDDMFEAGARVRTPNISGATQQHRDVLRRSMARADMGEFSFDQLGKTGRTMYEGMGADAPYRRFAEAMKEVLEKPTEQNNIMARSAFYRLVSMTGGLALEAFTIPRLMASRGFQNFLLGNAGLQKAMQKALATDSGEAVAETLGRIIRLYLTSATVYDEGEDNGEG